MAQTPTSVITSETANLDADLLTVGAIGVGIGATLFALRKGWKVVRSMI